MARFTVGARRAAAAVRWRRLKPYEKFAEMIERHWDGIAAYCLPENKIALGFVEGISTKSASFSAAPASKKREEPLIILMHGMSPLRRIGAGGARAAGDRSRFLSGLIGLIHSTTGRQDDIARSSRPKPGA
jgi:hypothetical protein